MTNCNIKIESEVLMKNSENKKIIILLTILFAIVIALLIVLIFKTNNLKKQPELDSSTITTTTTISFQKDENNQFDLSKLNNEEIKFVNIDELNEYEYTMENNLFQKINSETFAYKSSENNDNKVFEFDYIPFLKIENSKLFWKVNNKWVKDSNIKDDIKYFNYFSSADVTIYSFIAITSNKIYIIEIPDGIDTDSDILKEHALEEFNKKYSKLIYNVIDAKTESVIEKHKPIACNLYSDFYFSINNKTYRISNNKLKLASDYSEYFSDNLIEYLGTCEPDTASIKIDKNGLILDNNIDKTKINKVKYYLKNAKIEMIIDSNMNYYLITNNKDYYGKIDNLNFNKQTKLLTLTFNNNSINLKEVSYHLYDYSQNN